VVPREENHALEATEFLTALASRSPAGIPARIVDRYHRWPRGQAFPLHLRECPEGELRSIYSERLFIFFDPATNQQNPIVIRSTAGDVFLHIVGDVHE
jgi:hypothetical protein